MSETLPSQERKKQTGGLPASVIPEFVGDQIGTRVSFPSMSMSTVYFPGSVFFEVKAVTGSLTLGTSKWQILGLLDVAQIAGTNAPPQMHPPPAVYFTTTGNTVVSSGVLTKAAAWGVGVWQRKVYYDAHSANQNDPDLYLGDEECLTPRPVRGMDGLLDHRRAVAAQPVDVGHGRGASFRGGAGRP